MSTRLQFPTLRQPDAVLVSDAFPFGSVQVGEIIAFREPVLDGKTADVIVSRVIQMLADSLSSTVILTIVDANSGIIPGIDLPICEPDRIGKVYCLAVDDP
jgi:hypothetical protein